MHTITAGQWQVIETAQAVVAKLGDPLLCQWRHVDIYYGEFTPVDQKISINVGLYDHRRLSFTAVCNLLEVQSKSRKCDYKVYLDNRLTWRGTIIRSTLDGSVLLEQGPHPIRT
jgi:hypothetical protein